MLFDRKVNVLFCLYTFFILGYIMTVGWIFSILIATLPLFGISDYRKFAICLPFEISDTISLGKTTRQDVIVCATCSSIFHFI